MSTHLETCDVLANLMNHTSHVVAHIDRKLRRPPRFPVFGIGAGYIHFDDNLTFARTWDGRFDYLGLETLMNEDFFHFSEIVLTDHGKFSKSLETYDKSLAFSGCIDCLCIIEQFYEGTWSNVTHEGGRSSALGACYIGDGHDPKAVMCGVG